MRLKCWLWGLLEALNYSLAPYAEQRGFRVESVNGAVRIQNNRSVEIFVEEAAYYGESGERFEIEPVNKSLHLGETIEIPKRNAKQIVIFYRLPCGERRYPLRIWPPPKPPECSLI